MQRLCKATPVPKPMFGVNARIAALNSNVKRTKPPMIFTMKRYQSILANSRNEKLQTALAMVDEERRYRAYLQEGNDALVKLFTGNMSRTQEQKLAELKQRHEEEMRKAKESNKETRALDNQLRKERIERAKKLLDSMKPGPRTLHRALLESEMIRVRKYHEKVNEEIALNEERQQSIAEALCPTAPTLPLSHMDQQKLDAEARKKAIQYKDEALALIAERQQQKVEEHEKQLMDGIIEREQIRCLMEKEQHEADEKLKRRREFYQRAYREALKEKAGMELHEQISERIEDRKNCVFDVANRKLYRQLDNYARNMRKANLKQKEADAVNICRMQHAAEHIENERVQKDCERNLLEIQVDEERRKCELENKIKQRRLDQERERKLNAEEEARMAELKRFEFASRLKNEEAHKLYEKNIARKKQREQEKLGNIYKKQYVDAMERKQEELFRSGICPKDNALEDDKNFFNYAVELMQDSKKKGRPLYPINKAIENYKRECNIKENPSPHLVKRSQLHDSCNTGLVSRAKAKHAEYERKAKCYEENSKDLNNILSNCLIIKRLANSELQEYKCKPECPLKCMQHANNGLDIEEKEPTGLSKCPKVNKKAEIVSMTGNM